MVLHRKLNCNCVLREMLTAILSWLHVAPTDCVYRRWLWQLLHISWIEFCAFIIYYFIKLLSISVLSVLWLMGCVCTFALLVLCELLRPLCNSVMLMLILFSAREIGWLTLFVRCVCNDNLYWNVRCIITFVMKRVPIIVCVYNIRK